jgi:hypothetical protein
LFQEFVGKAFTEASSFVHKKYNICLIGVVQSKTGCSKESLFLEGNNLSQTAMLLNPGPSYKIRENDLCLYIALVKEENFNFKESRYKTCKL